MEGRMFSESHAVSINEVCPETPVHVYQTIRHPTEENKNLLEIN
jgi:hypothetical protein